MTEIDAYAAWAATKWNSRGLSTTLPVDIAEQLLNAVAGEYGEGGELADIVKKLCFHRMEYTEEVNVKVKKELGDRFYYLVTLCRLFGFAPSEILAANMYKLNARYPDGFSEERSNNRDESKEG